MLKGKRIILGVTGSIAAYKAAVLVRKLVEEGAEVRVLMTDLAKQFISPLTMATLSGNPVLVDFFNPEDGSWNSHVKLGIWADAYIIAPATANTIAKMATGIADNLLLTTYLSARCPIFLAPAMDLDMYAQKATTRNLAQLTNDGVNIIAPGNGFLASGLSGKGRMEEPEKIVKTISDFFASPFTSDELWGKKVVITAGGTIEQIDAVRFISNYSTGKMGYALANEFVKRGAFVTIIHGSVNSDLIGSIDTLREIKATSAEDMCRKAISLQPDADIMIMAAAVADYTPAEVSKEKIKKNPTDKNLTLELKETRDIAANIGAIKKEGQILIGFALESSDEESNAIDKLKRKNLDFIVLNSLRERGAGFATDTNKITIFKSDGTRQEYPLKSKAEVAKDIANEAVALLK